MRPYEQSHSWISFTADLRKAPHGFWMMLGEARSKIDHIAGVPLPPFVHRELNTLYLAKGVQATTAIEGNTLSEDEVLAIVEGHSTVPVSRAYQQKEVENILEACRQIDDSVLTGTPIPLTSDAIKQFNLTVLDGLELEEGVVPGQYRKHSVVVGRVYRGAPWEDCEYLVDRMCTWLNEFQITDGNDWGHATAIFKAILAHLYIAWIHPFGDGNGRTARLVEYLILVNAGVPCAAAHLMSNHYNRTKDAYYRELQRASAIEGGDITSFLVYALTGLVDELKESLEKVREFQRSLVWKDLVNESFQGERPSTTARRKLLLEHVVVHTEATGTPVTAAMVAAMSPAMEMAYQGKTTKTITRDLNACVELLLLRKVGRGYVSNRRIVDSFLPLKMQ